MDFQATPYTVTTAVMVVFALFVMYIRTKQKMLDSNIPLIFYVLMIVYMRAVDGIVPFWLILTGLGLTSLLRFEFMGTFLVKSVRFLEVCALGSMVYLGMRMVLQI